MLIGLNIGSGQRWGESVGDGLWDHATPLERSEVEIRIGIRTTVSGNNAIA